MNRVLNIGNMTNKNSYNIYISLGKRSITVSYTHLTLPTIA